MDDELTDWTSAPALIALMRIPRVGAAKALAVARGERAAGALLGHERLAELRELAEREVDAARHNGVRVLGFFDEAFPSRLRSIPAPPAVVYVRGDLAAFAGPALAVIGTREPSSFGTTATQQLTAAAAGAGQVIVSGLALGVDALAHEAALAAGARTVAVLGSGVDAVTPRQNVVLADRIVASGGALVSEQPHGTKPSPRTLVARNRLQAGLSDALLVTQTGIKGGSMHTVRFAAEQGRPVWCPVPHADNEKSDGLEALLSTPAQELPGQVPAWKEHARLATRLGVAPLACGVTAATVDEWLDELGRVKSDDPDAEHFDLYT